MKSPCCDAPLVRKRQPKYPGPKGIVYGLSWTCTKCGSNCWTDPQTKDLVMFDDLVKGRKK